MKKFFLVVLLLLLTSCNKSYKSFNFFYMDTYINVKIYDSSFNKESELESVFEYYHKLFDRFNEHDLVNVYYLNEVLNINEKIVISDDLVEILNLSIYYNEFTNNKFNIALGNPIDVWKSSVVLPTFEELSFGSYNIDDIVLESNAFLKKSDLKIDLGAIAKGYVCDKVQLFLIENGYDEFLINSGGQVLVNGDRVFKVGIEDPISESVFKVLNLKNMSVSSSGSYKRFYEFDEGKFSHIIDPDTLFPNKNVISVNVVASNGIYADVLSTYLSLLDVDSALSIVNNLSDVEAIFYVDSNNILYSNGIGIYE